MADQSVVASLSIPRQSWNFVRHFLEMCIPMCVGVGVVALGLAGLGAFGIADPRTDWPAASLLAIAIVISLPMIGWMRFRGMGWQPILEMTAAGILLTLLAAAAGLISVAPVLPGDVCGIECVGMVAVMLFRLDLYTGRTGHHAMHASANG